VKLGEHGERPLLQPDVGTVAEPPWGWAQLQTPVPGLIVGIGQSEEGVKAGGGATLTFAVEDIDAARAYLEGAGVRFDGETRQIEDMVRLATFYDPDGNTLMLSQQLA